MGIHQIENWGLQNHTMRPYGRVKGLLGPDEIQNMPIFVNKFLKFRYKIRKCRKQDLNSKLAKFCGSYDLYLRATRFK